MHPDFDYVSQREKNLKSKKSRELIQAQVSTTTFIYGERNMLPIVKKINIKYCQCTVTAIQTTKRICVSSKFKQLTQKIGR